MKQSLQNTNDSFLKSRDDIALLMEKILQRARQKGATAAAVSTNYDRGFNVDVRMGSVDTLSFNEDRGISATVYIGHQVGQASSTDTSDTAIDTMIDAALAIAHVSAKDKCFGLADPDLMSRSQQDLDLFHHWELSTEEAIDIALNCEKIALAVDKRIVNSDGTGLSTHSSCYGYANSHGAFGVRLSSHHSLSCAVLADEGGKFQRDYDYSSSRLPSQLASPESIAKNAAENTIKKLGARKIKTRKAPVIFSNRLSAGFINHFINAVSGGNLYRKNSFLLDSVGQAVFPQFVRIYEQPYLKGAIGSGCFDADGVVTRNNTIVDAGILQQYILGTYTARRLGLETTANAGGVHNLTVDANAKDLDALIKTMGTGLVVTDLMGQGVNGLTGDYSRGACGFWVENGEIQYPVEEVTIAGNLKQMFQSIDAIAADINPNYSVKCGSILLSHMTIAGA